MKVLILGSGGREHAIAWKLRQDEPGIEVIAAPGNPGIEEIGRCVRLSPIDAAAVASLAESEGVDLVVIGPEAPLAAGVADHLRLRGHTVFGPSAAAARIESSKRFAKELMLRAGVPTAAATWHVDAEDAKRTIRTTSGHVVVKASGLAAGKGVIVASTHIEAERAVDAMMLHGAFGAAGSEVLVEEFMEGEEVSVFAITDGTGFVLLPPSQDHKRLLEGDQGPNTGGMGAYTPVSVASREILDQVCDRIVEPTLHALRRDSAPFSGLLYAGLMLTPDGPKVVEFNCRFGDPETQVVLPSMDDALLGLLLDAAKGQTGAFKDISRAPKSAVTTVVAASGYPDSPSVGDVVELPDPGPNGIVFHAGTARRDDGALVSSGGRVLSLTGVAESSSEAAATSRKLAESVGLKGKQFRSDIGWRELSRHARTT